MGTTGSMDIAKSSFNPSVSSIISYPYIISKEYYLANGLGESFSFEDELSNSVAKLKDMLQIIIQREQGKEENFINSFFAPIKEKDPDTYSKIEAYLGRGLDKSRAIDMIQKYRMGLLNNFENIESDLRNFDKKWELFYNKIFMQTLKKINAPDALNLTLEDYISFIQNQMERNVQDESAKEGYNKFLNNVFGAVKELTKTKFGQDFEKSLNTLESNSYIKSKRKEHSKGNKGQSIEEIVKGYLFGIMNGLSAEQFLVSFGGGSSTARFSQAISTITKGGQSSSVAIKTDVIEILNADLEFSPSDQSSILNDLEKTNQALYQYIQQIDDKTAFIVHTSVKDQSTNKKYGSGKSMTVDITKSASLDTRLGPLRDIAASLSNGKDVENLIFAIANAGDYMVASGLRGEILIGITSLCAAYMFEDYVETFSQFESETSNKHLHLYFANGKYYTVSDILTLTLNTLNVTNKSRYVKISFNPTKIDEFNDKSLEGLHGESKWEQVRTNTLRDGNMSVRLDTNALLNDIYPF